MGKRANTALQRPEHTSGNMSLSEEARSTSDVASQGEHGMSDYLGVILPSPNIGEWQITPLNILSQN